MAKDVLPVLKSNIASNVLKNQKKKSRKWGVRPRKRFILFILNRKMNDIMKIIISLENSGLIIKDVTYVVQNEV